MVTTTTEEKLRERIKELKCLYDVTTTILQHSGILEPTLSSIVGIVQKAYCYPDAVVQLQLDGIEVSTGALPAQTVSQQSVIIVNGSVAGRLGVHYRVPQYTQEHFLEEEQMLLDKVAVEVAHFYEKLLAAEKEQILQRSIERADRLTILGEITAGIAHELNTPLGNILGFAELIQQSAQGQTADDIEKIISSAIHSREIVKKLMFFACEMPQQMELTELEPIITTALTFLGQNFKRKNVTYNFSAPDVPVKARVDSVQFTQVLFNILLNAIYASPQNGTVNVKLYVDGAIFIDIEDEGEGIPAELKGKVFEPFFTTKPIGEGTGLGLSVVHGIVRGHGGEITVHDNDKGGATFRVRLPLKQ
jgi:two-component system NtrC family sensor kinase